MQAQGYEQTPRNNRVGEKPAHEGILPEIRSPEFLIEENI
jgi:hypothetical protein